MPRFLLDSIGVGLHTLRSNPTRTVLSTLGVIIGVGALVSILSIGDSLEAFSRQQIEETTDLKAISISPRATEIVNGIRVQRKTIPSFSSQDVLDLSTRLRDQATVSGTLTRSGWVHVGSDTVSQAAQIVATFPPTQIDLTQTILSGRSLSSEDFSSETSVALISRSLAAMLSPDTSASLVGTYPARKASRIEPAEAIRYE